MAQVDASIQPEHGRRHWFCSFCFWVIELPRYGRPSALRKTVAQRRGAASFPLVTAAVAGSGSRAETTNLNAADISASSKPAPAANDRAAAVSGRWWTSMMKPRAIVLLDLQNNGGAICWKDPLGPETPTDLSAPDLATAAVLQPSRPGAWVQIDKPVIVGEGHDVYCCGCRTFETVLHANRYVLDVTERDIAIQNGRYGGAVTRRVRRSAPVGIRR